QGSAFDHSATSPLTGIAGLIVKTQAGFSPFFPRAFCHAHGPCAGFGGILAKSATLDKTG
ncbi:MAG: hypothetical protein ACO37E_09405, partial [Lutimaribacter sp.]